MPLAERIVHIFHWMEFRSLKQSNWPYFFRTQSTPQQPTQVQHTQSALPPMPSLVNNMHPQQPPQQQQPLKTNQSLPQQQQPPPPNMVQAQNALNNNDINQSFPAQPIIPNLSLAGLLGRPSHLLLGDDVCWTLTFAHETKFLILDNKNHGLPSLNPLMPPINSMNDKSSMNMMPNFDDPVEQSLASLEQSLACK